MTTQTSQATLPTYQLIALPILTDNYIWALRNDTYIWLVDPGHAEPALNYIAQHNLILADILVTHHHYDHVNGIPELLPHVTGQVYGASRHTTPNMILTQKLNPNSQISLTASELTVEVLDTSGHTYDHVSYLLPTIQTQYGQKPLLLAGDAIFSAGCGRLFDGTIEQTYETFNKINKLSEETLIACTHEYTLDNLAFCLSLNPDHPPTLHHYNRVKCWVNSGQTSLPTDLAIERQINPYFRCLRMDSDWLAALQSVGIEAQTPFEAFAATRKLKDQFRPT